MKNRPILDYMLGTLFFCAMLMPIACTTLRSITPADRAAVYEKEAQGVEVICKAYRFDRSTGLVYDVPRMTRLCEVSKTSNR